MSNKTVNETVNETINEDAENIEDVLTEIFQKASKNKIFDISVKAEGPATKDDGLESRILYASLGKALLEYTKKNPGHNITFIKETHKFYVDEDKIAHLEATFSCQLSDSIIREVFRTIQLATKSKNVQDLHFKIDSRMFSNPNSAALKRLRELILGVKGIETDCSECKHPCADGEDAAISDLTAFILNEILDRCN